MEGTEVIDIIVFKLQLYRGGGMTTLTNAVSGQSQNCSSNLEISPGIGTFGNFFQETSDNSMTLQK